MKVVIIGNSGSGKSTLAHWLACRSGAALLDLDTVAWEPDQVANARPPDVAARMVEAFCSANPTWVVEGCYAGLAEYALRFAPVLIFMNPGVEQCRRNCRARPWEPHKYASKQQQDAQSEMLLAWVEDYYRRSDDMSLQGHRALFDAYRGSKLETVTQLDLERMVPVELANLL